MRLAFVKRDDDKIHSIQLGLYISGTLTDIVPDTRSAVLQLLAPDQKARPGRVNC